MYRKSYEQMKIYTNTLDIKNFKNDFVYLYRGKDKEQALDGILELINESDCSIPSFLRKIDLIEDKEIQKSCRHAAVAQMYNAGLDYRCGSCYVETPSYCDVVLIQDSTVILSKYGDILFNEGEIWTHSGLNYGRGFFVKKIIDGKWGFIDNNGARVLPCIFDAIEGHMWEAEFYYGPLHFNLRIYGNKDSIGRDKLQKMIDDYDGYDFICLSEDSILSSLHYMGSQLPQDIQGSWAVRNNKPAPWNRDKLTEALRTELSPILVSKEKLQEILESK